MRKPVALCLSWIDTLLGYVPAIFQSIEEMMLDDEDVMHGLGTQPRGG